MLLLHIFARVLIARVIFLHNFNQVIPLTSKLQLTQIESYEKAFGSTGIFRLASFFL